MVHALLETQPTSITTLAVLGSASPKGRTAAGQTNFMGAARQEIAALIEIKVARYCGHHLAPCRHPAPERDRR
jgi:hypothetical protein